MRTGLYAIVTLGAAFEEQRFFDRTRGPEPVFPDDRRWLLRLSLFVFGKFLRGSRDGKDRVLEEIAAPVFGIGSHGIT